MGTQLQFKEDFMPIVQKTGCNPASLFGACIISLFPKSKEETTEEQKLLHQKLDEFIGKLPPLKNDGKNDQLKVSDGKFQVTVDRVLAPDKKTVIPTVSIRWVDGKPGCSIFTKTGLVPRWQIYYHSSHLWPSQIRPCDLLTFEKVVEILSGHEKEVAA